MQHLPEATAPIPSIFHARKMHAVIEVIVRPVCASLNRYFPVQQQVCWSGLTQCVCTNSSQLFSYLPSAFTDCCLELFAFLVPVSLYNEFLFKFIIKFIKRGGYFKLLALK